MAARDKRDDPHEIDIVEGQGAIPNRDYMTVHYPQPGGGSGFDQGTYDNPQSLQGTPHTYAVDWRPNSITWYLDGVARFRDTNAAHIPHQLMYVLVDFAVGGWVRKWNGIPGPDDVFPATMSVSYVRVWNRKP